MTVTIARCPEHGLHGDREECFVCGGPVEQVRIVPIDDEAIDRASRALFERDVKRSSIGPSNREQIWERVAREYRAQASAALIAAGVA